MPSNDAQAQRVLVVEDNDFVRMQIVKYLKDSGYETMEASEGDTAMEIMSSKDVVLAIVDVRMEPVGGFEFVSALRAKSIKLPVILVTGDQNLDILEKARILGIDTVLLKPVQKDRLISMVGRALR